MLWNKPRSQSFSNSAGCIGDIHDESGGRLQLLSVTSAVSFAAIEHWICDFVRPSYLVAMGFLRKFARSVFLSTGPWWWWVRISQLCSRRILTFVRKKPNFGDESWLANFFPSSGSFLKVFRRLGLRPFLLARIVRQLGHLTMSKIKC